MAVVVSAPLIHRALVAFRYSGSGNFAAIVPYLTDSTSWFGRMTSEKQGRGLASSKGLWIPFRARYTP